MSQLDELLAVADQQARQAAMIKYARALGINPYEAKNDQGEMLEEKLAAMIFDAEQLQTASKKRHKVQDQKFLAVGAFYLGLMLLVLISLPRILKYLYEENVGPDTGSEKVYKGYDKKGDPVKGEEQPVLFKLMEGTFEERWDNGQLKSEQHYKQGQLLLERKYNRNGRLISEEKFEFEPGQ